MRAKLTDDEIAQARKLRAAGKQFPEIVALLELDVDPSTVRQHCLDLEVDGEVRSRVDTKKEFVGRGGAPIRLFTADEDRAIVGWKQRGERDEAGEKMSMNKLAEGLSRKRHSVAARIKTLQKHGKI